MLEVINVSSNINRKQFNSKNILLFICVHLFSLPANGQNFNLNDYPFTIDDVELENAFTGGLTNPQLAEIDFNDDGFLDLLVYDRRGDVARTYLHEGGIGSSNYIHDEKYQIGLPPLRNFIRVQDYNNDGVPDIFTGPASLSSASISVYTGQRDANGLRFSIYEVDWISNVLTVMTNGAPTNVYSNLDDIPAILDMDGDGDIDILSFEGGGSYVNFYKNMAVEKNLGLDTFDFVFGDFCWGKFKEGGTDGTIFLSDDPNECAIEFGPNENFAERHAGSTIEAFDYQCDGDYDLLIGDLVSSNIVLLINEPFEGNDFMVESVSNFPIQDPVDLYTFPTSWVLDIDKDGDQDIIFCPNEDSNATNVDVMFYYENNGGMCNQDFSLVTKDFINNKSIDLGTDSNPVFLDYNADGLLDILVGTTGEFGPTGQPEKIRLVLFENIGDAENPAFQLIDDDWLNFSINTEFSTNPSLAVGDLDGDNDDDMLVADEGGSLYYFENISSVGEAMEFAQALFPFPDIDVGASVHPYIYDYNQDGLGDLFLGEKNTNSNEGLGNVNYFENLGTIGNPEFNDDSFFGPNTPTFNYINTKLEFETGGYSAPVLFDAGEELYALCGTFSGYLQLYVCDRNDVDAQAELLDLQFGNIYEGEQTAIDLEDIDNDGYLEVIVGNKRGGLAIYNTVINLDETISQVQNTESYLPEIKLYPNPTSDFLQIESTVELSEYTINNIFGQIIQQGSLLDSKTSTSNIPPGVYFISFKLGDAQVVKKFMKN